MSQLPSNLSRELFMEWRSPRRGTTNPHVMTNDIWVWLVNERLNAYQASETFNGPSSMQAGPCWCFDRFGQSETTLPDGRTIFVAGEHEDYYDPDFYIYNDVTVIELSGEIAIYGYPVDIFPATDFHSATLVGNNLILIGSLGYVKERKHGLTQVLSLELGTWRISKIETSGDNPGWIHGHKACLSEVGNEILISGGEFERDEDASLVENIDEWSLDLDTWQWIRLTRRNWPRFEIVRKNGKQNHLWEMRQLAWQEKLPDLKTALLGRGVNYEKQLKKEIGAVPDLKRLESLYASDVATEIIPEDEDEYGTYRVRVGDVIVRYVEDSYSIQMTIEGELLPDIVEQLKNDLMKKLAELERSPMVCQMIVSQ